MSNVSKKTFITAIIAKKGQTVISEPYVIVNSVECTSNVTLMLSPVDIVTFLLVAPILGNETYIHEFGIG